MIPEDQRRLYNLVMELTARVEALEGNTPQPDGGDGAVADALMVVNDAANDARHAGDYAKANALVKARVTLYQASIRPSAAVVVGEKFVRAWIDMKEFPGGMMMSSFKGETKRFGPVAATSGCGITTDERTKNEWLRAGRSVIEIWDAFAQPRAE